MKLALLFIARCTNKCFYLHIEHMDITRMYISRNLQSMGNQTNINYIYRRLQNSNKFYKKRLKIANFRFASCLKQTQATPTYNFHFFFNDLLKISWIWKALLFREIVTSSAEKKFGILKTLSLQACHIYTHLSDTDLNVCMYVYTQGGHRNTPDI